MSFGFWSMVLVGSQAIDVTIPYTILAGLFGCIGQGLCALFWPLQVLSGNYLFYFQVIAMTINSSESTSTTTTTAMMTTHTIINTDATNTALASTIGQATQLVETTTTSTITSTVSCFFFFFYMLFFTYFIF
jgi:hypothetical protein